MSLRASLFRCTTVTLCVLVLAGCARSLGGSSSGLAETTLTPRGTPLPPTPALTPPPGWTLFCKLWRLQVTALAGASWPALHSQEEL